MPEKRFRVNIYDVGFSGDAGPGTSFSTALDNAIAQPLALRYREANGKGRRLENDARRDDIYLLNFVTFEFAGPGRSRPITPAQHINLGADESFAHETAMLYDPNAELAFVESTQGGMGPGAIASYFAAFAGDRTEYLLLPRLDDGAGARARRHETIRTIRSLFIQVSIGPVTAADREAGTGVLKAFANDYSASSINVEIKAGRGKRDSLLTDSIKSTINALLGRSDETAITKLQVKGRQHDDDPYEIIDLIQHREKRDVPLPVDSSVRKVLHPIRWDALLSIHQDFLRNVGHN